jgi:HPt (histidine-containing phosphotransfer) domain-containing protein
MDGYVSKPIRSLALAKAISEVMSLRRAGKEPARIGNQADGAINEAALLEGVDGNRRLLRELVKLFLADYPLHLAQIRDALRDGDAETLEKAAHTLKGAIGNFAAEKAVAAAQLMEVLARDRELRAASDAYAALESELVPVVQELKRIVTNPAKRKPKANKM